MGIKPTFLLLCCSLAAGRLLAQYPVQVMPQLTPPYSLQLNDYYNSTVPKLAVLLTDRDLTRPSLNVRLKMTIAGQSATISTIDNAYYPPITLDAGVPLRVTGSELAPYFNPENLNFQGITRAQYSSQGQLPEGYYQFCFEAIETTTGRVVSSNSCAMAWLDLSDPPLLNLPSTASNIAFQDPLNIVFSWTPRNSGNPNSAFSTTYDFQLVEITDTTVDPTGAFTMLPPLYTAATAATTMLYGPGQPTLLTGHRYAWRVQAQAMSNGQQLSLFSNSGYSNVNWFTLEDNCQPPLSSTAVIENGGVHLSWVPQSAMLGYEVDYRLQGADTAAWFTEMATADSAVIYDVSPGQTYEYRIGGACSVAGGTTYGNVQAFSVPNGDTIGNPNCGILPNIDVTNKTPLPALSVNGVFMAGDFPVKVLTTSGGNGRFSGTGYVTVPFLGQAMVKVGWNGAGINTDHKLISGVVMTAFDATATQVANTDAVIQAGENMSVILSQLAGITADTSALTIRQLGDVINTAVDSLSPSAQEAVQADVNNLEAIKNSYDSLQQIVDSLPSGPARDSAQNSLDQQDSAFQNAQAGLQNDIEAFVPASLTYPYYQTVLVHYSYNVDPVRIDPIQIFSTKPVPAELQAELKNLIITRTLTDYGGQKDPDSLVFDFQPTGILYSSLNYANRVWAVLLYKHSATEALQTTKADTRVYTFNGTPVDGKDISLKDNVTVPAGTSTFSLQDTYTSTIITTTAKTATAAAHSDTSSKQVQLPALNVQVVNTGIDLHNCYVQVSRTGYPDKKVQAGYMLGSTSNNENPIKPGEVLTLALYLQNPDKSYTALPNPIWEIKGKTVDTLTATTETLTVHGGLQQIGVWPTADMKTYGTTAELILNTNLVPEANNLPATSIVPDYSPLACTDTTQAQTLFNAAIGKLLSKDSTFYKLIAQRSVTVHFEYNGFGDFANDGNLNGYTRPDYQLTDNLGPRSVTTIKKDAAGIIVDAALVESLNESTLSAIRTACTKKDISGTVGTILTRLNATNAAAAQTLKADVLAGKFDPAFLDTLTVTIRPTDDTTLYVNFSGSANIFINFTKVKAGTENFNETFGHELAHFEYEIDNQFAFLKWLTIRAQSKKAGAGYTLGDVLNHNSPPDGVGCSAGDGHEMYNPENKQVCAFGAKFQND